MSLKAEDIRNMTADEIKNKILSIKEELFNLRFQQKSGRVEKPHRINEAKREIARCLTILGEKENVGKAK